MENEVTHLTSDIKSEYTPLKVDRTKLLTINNYAKTKGVDRTTVYRWISEGSLKKIDIDGVFFIENK